MRKGFAAVMIAAGLALPGMAPADDVQAEIDEILEHVDTAARGMAQDMEQMPEAQHDELREALEQMISHAEWSLEVDAGASEAEISSFREKAEAIGHEHGVLD